MSKHPFVDEAIEYARSCDSGSVTVCEDVKLCARQFLDRLESSKSGRYPYLLDRNKAEKVCRFKSNFFHVKGEWARRKEKYVAQPWQSFATVATFGWVYRSSGLRLVRTVFKLLPRKNGKSFDAALDGSYLAFADDEPGAEVFAGATTFDQAMMVFKPAWLFAERNADYAEYYGLETSGTVKRPMAVYCDSSDSFFKPMVGQPGDGDNPQGAIIDEYHEHKTDGMVDTMETGMMSREQPLLYIVTTAGFDLSSPCFSMFRKCKKILRGVIEDDSVFALMYGLDEGDEWATMEAARKANPNFGVSVKAENVALALEKAKADPRKAAAYQTKNLNRWLGARDAFFNVLKWQSLAKPISPEDFAGRPVYGGLDLSSKYDLAAAVIVFDLGDGQYAQFAYNFLPRDTVDIEENEHYRAFEASGDLIVTEGNVIDYAVIEALVIDLHRRFNFIEVGFDPMQATFLSTRLLSEGVPMVEVPPRVSTMSEPMKEIDKWIRSSSVSHPEDSCFTWMMSNVVSAPDRKGNEYPNKEEPASKIDGPVAFMTAVNRLLDPITPGSLTEALRNPISARYG